MPVRKDFLSLKLVIGREDIDGFQEAYIKSNEPLFSLFSNNGFSLRELFLELFVIKALFHGMMILIL